MFLYVTERIKSYHKIGITKSITARIKQYNTLIPDLNYDLIIQLPSLKFAKLLEKTIKRRLSKFRIRKSECYNLKLEFIKDFILHCTLLTRFCVLDFHLFPIHRFPDGGQFGNKMKGVTAIGHGYSNGVVIFLNEIYFGNKIPLFHLKKIAKNRIKSRVISSCKNYQELSDLTNFDKEAMISWNIGLKNPLAKYLSEYDNKTIIINNTPGEIIKFLTPIVFQAIEDKVYNIKPNRPKYKGRIKQDKDFPYKHMALGHRFSREYSRKLKATTIFGTGSIDTDHYKKVTADIIKLVK